MRNAAAGHQLLYMTDGDDLVIVGPRGDSGTSPPAGSTSTSDPSDRAQPSVVSASTAAVCSPSRGARPSCATVPVRAMLSEDVVWHVPGRSAIAGDYGGRDEVLRYFVTRRGLAHATFRIHVRGVLADDERAVIFAGGQMQRHGETSAWETVGVFRIADGKIAECWVLPYDQYSFDEIWSPAPGSR